MVFMWQQKMIYGNLIPFKNKIFRADAQNDTQAVTFVELGARTTFSGLSIHGPVMGPTYAHLARGWTGAATPEELIRRTKAFDAHVVGITDLATIAGVVRGFKAGQAAGVRVIVGCEIPFKEGSIWLHVENAEGYENLCRFLTISRQDLPKDESHFQIEVLMKHAAGLWLTLLPGIEFQLIPRLQESFKNRISSALYAHALPEDASVLFWAQTLFESYGIPPLATARPFLVDSDDLDVHHILTCIRQHHRLSVAEHYLLPNAECRLRTTREMEQKVHFWRRKWPLMPCPLKRSVLIARSCFFELSQIQWTFPVTLSQGLCALQELQKRTYEGACFRYDVDSYKEVPMEIQQQIAHELHLIHELKVENYFLTVHEIVLIAKEKNILCQGRGSAANSIVCFCLGITSIDPVRMDLLFERFLSKERGEPPDIDVDFEHERREEVIQAIYEKWGRDHAALVCEVISFRGRSAVRAVGKVLDFIQEDIERICKTMLRSSLDDITSTRLAEEQIEASVGDVKKLLHCAQRLQKHPQHLGVHVGGFILTKASLNTVAPVEPARMANRTVLPFDKDDVETLGLFKMDVLGLGMLTCIRKAFQLIEQHTQKSWTLASLPAEDVVVYDALCRADTLGVFQIESRAQMSMLPRMRPRTFYDLVVQIAIVRPGPIQGGMVHPYLRRRSGEEKVTYPHPSLKSVLERTLGVPIFQEQVMKIAMIGAGYTPGEADQLRRDMAAWKKKGGLYKHRARLLAGFAQKGISEDFSKRLYLQVIGFGEYGFPESHAASFAILVYASAWLKTHEPAFFAAALLNSQPMGFYAPAQILADAQRHDVVVLPVCVQTSSWDCTLERNVKDEKWDLRLGLRMIKGLAITQATKVVRVRQKSGLFLHRDDFDRRTQLGKKSLKQLAASGAFDCFYVHRREAIYNSKREELPLLLQITADSKEKALSAPHARDVLKWDLESQGVSLDDHPVLHLRRSLKKYGVLVPLPIQNILERTSHGQDVEILGLVIGRQRPSTASGTCFLTLEDELGMINVIVWGSEFEKWRRPIRDSPFLWVKGRLEKKDAAIHLIATAMHGLQGEKDIVPVAQGRFFH